MIRISIECKVGKTVFTKTEVVENWKSKRTNADCNRVFRELLTDMRIRVREFTAPEPKAETELEKTEP